MFGTDYWQDRGSLKIILEMYSKSNSHQNGVPAVSPITEIGIVEISVPLELGSVPVFG